MWSTAFIWSHGRILPSHCSQQGKRASSSALLIRSGIRSTRFLSVRMNCNGEKDGSMTTEAKDGRTEEEKDKEEEEEANRIALERLEQYVELNRGSWSGTFTQYDCFGKAMATVPVKLNANVYGKGEHLALYQTLYVKQARSPTSVSGDSSEPQWIEFNIADIDLVTMEQRHKVGYFDKEKAYCLSHVTAKVLDVVLRTGLLGEDDDEEQDYFPGVKLPCRRPALVCESCMFSTSGNSRLRAYHVLNSQGLLDMIGVFHEHKDDEHAEDLLKEELTGLNAVLGEWSGRAVTKRTGLYGSTIAEEELLFGIEKRKDREEIVQTLTSSWKDKGQEETKLVVNGNVHGNMLRFTDGLQTTLLPGGMSITCPMSVGNCVRGSRSFFLEFSWIDSPRQRKRLVRTYDTSGAVVSTTLSKETKQVLTSERLFF